MSDFRVETSTPPKVVSGEAPTTALGTVNHTDTPVHDGKYAATGATRTAKPAADILRAEKTREFVQAIEKLDVKRVTDLLNSGEVDPNDVAGTGTYESRSNTNAARALELLCYINSMGPLDPRVRGKEKDGFALLEAIINAKNLNLNVTPGRDAKTIFSGAECAPNSYDQVPKFPMYNLGQVLAKAAVSFDLPKSGKLEKEVAERRGALLDKVLSNPTFVGYAGAHTDGFSELLHWRVTANVANEHGIPVSDENYEKMLQLTQAEKPGLLDYLMVPVHALRSLFGGRPEPTYKRDEYMPAPMITVINPNTGEQVRMDFQKAGVLGWERVDD